MPPSRPICFPTVVTVILGVSLSLPNGLHILGDGHANLGVRSTGMTARRVCAGRCWFIFKQSEPERRHTAQEQSGVTLSIACRRNCVQTSQPLGSGDIGQVSSCVSVRTIQPQDEVTNDVS